MKILLLLITFSFSTICFSGQLIRIDNCANQTVCDAILNPILNTLPPTDSGTFAAEMANANVISQKGYVADYTDNMKVFSTGAGFGIGMSLGSGQSSSNTNALKLPGVSISTGLSFGLKNRFLPKILLPIENIYFHVFSHKIKNSKYNAETTSFGTHLQFKLIDMNPNSYLFSFGNVMLTTGLTYNTLNFDYTQHFSQSSGGFTLDGDFTIGSKSSVFSIPIELSSNIRVLYLLNLYAGLAADLNFGSAEPISSNNATVTGGLGTPVLDLGSKTSPDFIKFRQFIGFQLNFAMLKFFGQVNTSNSGKLLGIATGIKIIL